MDMDMDMSIDMMCPWAKSEPCLGFDTSGSPAPYVSKARSSRVQQLLRLRIKVKIVIREF